MGAAGDMLLAALFELHENKKEFLEELNNIGLQGVSVRAESSYKCGIKGTRIVVEVNGKEEFAHSASFSNSHKHTHDEHRHTHEGHDHTHEEHDHTHRHNSYLNIEQRINSLKVSNIVKKNALEVYKLIAEAESHAHGVPVKQIHFHEVGEMDAVADIIGVCMLMEELAPDRIIASPVCTGSGLVRCMHGILPVPAPATAYILRDIPSYGGEIKAELCTPTGAAILKHFVDEFGPMPEMRVQKIGYGMGKKDFETANCVRVFCGISNICGSDPVGINGDENNAGGSGQNNQVAELQCNLDDMTAEALGFACQTLMEAGALDVFTIACGMKKERPGVLLVCLCDTAKADEFAALILKYTTTFGVRKAVLSRYTLERETKTALTQYGKVRLKIGRGYGVTKTKPEYEDVAKMAKTQDCSISEMERLIWESIERGELRVKN